MKKKQNAEEKRKQRSDRFNVFAKKYARKAQPGQDPNDRNYDHRLERKMQRMKPEVLDKILRDEPEG